MLTRMERLSTRIESKRMTYHNTPQLSGMDSANHCAAFPGLSALSTTTILTLKIKGEPIPGIGRGDQELCGTSRFSHFSRQSVDR
jgi:hypothetical protein